MFYAKFPKWNLQSPPTPLEGTKYGTDDAGRGGKVGDKKFEHFSEAIFSFSSFSNGIVCRVKRGDGMRVAMAKQAINSQGIQM